MDIAASLSELVGLPIGVTTMTSFIHKDNAGVLVLAEEILAHFTLRINNYATKKIWFCEEIVKHSIELSKINTVKYLGDLSKKG